MVWILPSRAGPGRFADRLRFLVLVLMPWVGLYELTAAAQDGGRSFESPVDAWFPLWPETMALYWSSYLTVPLAPWFARTSGQVRALMLRGWAATAAVFPFYWLVPSSAPRPPLEDGDWFARWLLWERDAYPAVAAFPSFHVIWAVIVAPLLRPRWLGPSYAVLVSVSCLTTKQHYVADVAGGLLVGGVLVLDRATERLRHAAARVLRRPLRGL